MSEKKENVVEGAVKEAVTEGTTAWLLYGFGAAVLAGVTAGGVYIYRRLRKSPTGK